MPQNNLIAYYSVMSVIKQLIIYIYIYIYIYCHIVFYVHTCIHTYKKKTKQWHCNDFSKENKITVNLIQIQAEVIYAYFVLMYISFSTCVSNSKTEWDF